jgi:hypothetical protein
MYCGIVWESKTQFFPAFLTLAHLCWDIVAYQRQDPSTTAWCGGSWVLHVDTKKHQQLHYSIMVSHWRSHLSWISSNACAHCDPYGKPGSIEVPMSQRHQDCEYKSHQPPAWWLSHTWNHDFFGILKKGRMKRQRSMKPLTMYDPYRQTSHQLMSSSPSTSTALRPFLMVSSQIVLILTHSW